LASNTVYRTYTFPADVHYPDSYLNDLRFDFNPDLSDTSGEGIAYLVDSSNEGRPGFIMVDLASGKSWRRLTQDPSVLRTPNTVPTYFGKPFHFHLPGQPISWPQEGLDGIQLSPDGSRLYYSPLVSTHLFSIPTANLREQGQLSEIHARANVSDHGQRGGQANGFEGDSLGNIYQLMPEQNAIYYYDPQDGLTKGLLQDPRILWPDGASVAADGYIYMNINQLPFQPDWNNGTDLRTFPGAVLRAKLPEGATKISTLFDY
jgi:sugar lactone lactonase YvrE